MGTSDRDQIRLSHTTDKSNKQLPILPVLAIDKFHEPHELPNTTNMKFTNNILTATIGFVSIATAAPSGENFSNTTHVPRKEKTYNGWFGRCQENGMCKDLGATGTACYNSQVSDSFVPFLLPYTIIQDKKTDYRSAFLETKVNYAWLLMTRRV